MCHTVRTVLPPAALSLQLYQVVGLGAHLISEVYLPVPEGQGPAEGGTLASYQFSDSREVVFGNNAVGSGGCTCACMHVYVCACVHVCMYVYVRVYLCVS